MIRRIITVLIAVLAFSPLTPVATAVNYGTPLGPTYKMESQQLEQGEKFASVFASVALTLRHL